MRDGRTDGRTDGQTDRQTGIQTDRQTDRQKDRQNDRQTGRKTDESDFIGCCATNFERPIPKQIKEKRKWTKIMTMSQLKK